MQTEQLAQLIPGDFADDSRVWVYQCNRPFSDKEELEINEQMHHFYAQWETHGMRVKGWAKVLFKQFIVVMADEKRLQHRQHGACNKKPGKAIQY
jgi:hypothetical protein